MANRPRTILEDTRNKPGRHEAKRAHFERMGYQIVRTKLYTGDYALVGGTYACDTKQSIQEMAANIDQQHERLRREMVNARDAGYRLFFVIENEHGLSSLEELSSWREPDDEFRRRRYAVRRLSGARLARAMSTMRKRYGAEFVLCSPQRAGEAVLSILESEVGEDG